MDKYDFRAQEVGNHSSMPGRLDPVALAVIAAALREAKAEAFEEAADMLASHGEQPLTPNAVRLRWANKMSYRAASLRAQGNGKEGKI